MSIVKKLCKLLATGTMTLFIAACYGPMYIAGRLSFVAKSLEGSGIKGLQVSLFGQTDELIAEDSTDGKGRAAFSVNTFESPISATIVDVDGAANGGTFATADVTVDSLKEYDVEMTKE